MGRSKKSQAKKREKQKKVTELKKKKLKEKKTDRGGASKENTLVQTEPAKTRPSTGVSKYTVEQLLQKAEEYIDTLDYELALKFCQRALEVDENRVQALETAGTVYIELGGAESALKYFNRAVTLSPNNGFSKYMYLGQLNEGKQAIECFQKGVELMLKDREDGKEALEGACANPEETTTVSDRDISRAYCSMAEIYLTDSCFEEDAEQRCKDCLDKAIEADTDNAEAHQLLASYLLSINNPEDAKTAIEKSLSLWLPQWREHLEKSEVSEAFELCPLSYEVRISTAKILIELQLFLEAIEVLDGLLEEDDEVVQVLYLMGWTYYQSQLKNNKKGASYYLTKAQQIFAKVGCDDGEMLEHIEELLGSLGPSEEFDEDDDDEDDDNDDGDNAAMETDDDDDNIENSSSDDDDDDDETSMEH